MNRLSRTESGAAEPWLAAVQARLATSAYPSVRQLQCDLQTDTLILQGEVANYFEKQFAQELVAGVPGVRRVVNQTRVSHA
jgi:osmotically-inducible protein OsmY